MTILEGVKMIDPQTLTLIELNIMLFLAILSQIAYNPDNPNEEGKCYSILQVLIMRLIFYKDIPKKTPWIKRPSLENNMLLFIFLYALSTLLITLQLIEIRLTPMYRISLLTLYSLKLIGVQRIYLK